LVRRVNVFNNIILSVMAWTTNVVGGFVTRLKEERGQDILEYAVLAGAIALIAGGALYLIGPDIFETFAEQIEYCVTFDEQCGA
jgi:Flp pilus assembly pilin Flp